MVFLIRYTIIVNDQEKSKYIKTKKNEEEDAIDALHRLIVKRLND